MQVQVGHGTSVMKKETITIRKCHDLFGENSEALSPAKKSKQKKAKSPAER